MKNKKGLDRDTRKVISQRLGANLEDLSILNEIEKFHQSTTWQIPYKWTFSKQILDWESLVEYHDTLPEAPISVTKIIPTYEIPSYTKAQSTRIFDKSKIIPQTDFANILGKAFGRYGGLGSKNYPSAGGLYPVVPIVILLSGDAIQGIDRGVYVYNSEEYQLEKIKVITEDNISKIIRNLNSIFPDKALSNISFAYAIDIKKATIKYGKRGYRHALIELGLISESLKTTYGEFSESYGDCVWSGFNDNALTVECGLNVKLMPIGLVQWFGVKKNGIQ